MPSGKPALMLDIGSVGDLAGDEWGQYQSAVAMRAGLRPEHRRRQRPLAVRGVGRGGEVHPQLRVASHHCEHIWSAYFRHS